MGRGYAIMFPVLSGSNRNSVLIVISWKTHIEPDVFRERNPNHEMPILPIFRK